MDKSLSLLAGRQVFYAKRSEERGRQHWRKQLFHHDSDFSYIGWDRCPITHAARWMVVQLRGRARSKSKTIHC